MGMEQKEGGHSPSLLLECPEPFALPCLWSALAGGLMMTVGALQLQPALCDEALSSPLLQMPSLLLRCLKDISVPCALACGASDLAVPFLSER